MPNVDPAQLDAQLDRYAQDGAFPYVTSNGIAPRSVSPRVRELSDADVYTLRAMLYLSAFSGGADNQDEARKNLRLALAQEPGHVQATAILARLDHPRLP